ncbi:MAG: hypothetical protein M3400_14540 [Actinomycetota bacterium]|nr:hypothetical protein [Actinomycetota bacterium]
MPLALNHVVLLVLFAAVLMLPGLALGMAAALNRWTSVACAPVVSYGLITITGEICSLLGIGFGLLPLIGTTGVVCFLVLAARRLGARRPVAQSSGPAEPDGQRLASRPGRGRTNDLWITAGVVVGTALGAATVLIAMGSLEAVTQGTDSIWHVNLIRFVMESADASPTAVAEVRGFDQAFYPNAYHLSVALVGMVGDSSLMALTGAHLMLVAGVAGLGLAGLLRWFTRRTAIAAAVPVVTAMFYLFPYYLMAWGPLWPFLTGIALVPGFLLLLSEALERGHRAIAVLVVTGMAAAGLLAVHTSAAITAAIFGLFLLAARWVKARSVPSPDLLVVAGVALTAALAAPVYLAATVGVARLVPEANVDWPVVGPPGATLGNLLFLNTGYLYPPYWLVALIVVGVLGWRRLRSMAWWFAASGVFLALYVAAASYNSPLTEAVTILWWNDYLRLGAIVCLALIVLAACGLVTLVDTVIAAARRRVPQAAELGHRRLWTVTGLFVALCFGILTNGLYLSVNAANLNTIYQDGELISADEQEAMYALADMVGPQDRVMNDPNDGSPWMWALVNVRPMFAHTVADITHPRFTSDNRLLMQSFRCLDSDRDVRAAIEDNDITHVFLGQGFIGSNFNRVEGLENIGGSSSLRLVYDENDIEIYEIDVSAALEAPRGACAR